MLKPQNTYTKISIGRTESSDRARSRSVGITEVPTITTQI